MLGNTPLPVRENGPDPSPEMAAKLLANTFARLVAAMRTRQADPRQARPVTNDDIEEHLRRGEQDAHIIGLTQLLTVMVRGIDPRGVCISGMAPIDVDPEALITAYNMIDEWITQFHQFADGENTDEVWELFLRAVAAAESANMGHPEKFSEANLLVAELQTLAPATDNAGNWHLRVWDYAIHIAPEYRRWFAHLLNPADVELPRI